MLDEGGFEAVGYIEVRSLILYCFLGYCPVGVLERDELGDDRETLSAACSRESVFVFGVDIDLAMSFFKGKEAVDDGEVALWRLSRVRQFFGWEKRVVYWGDSLLFRGDVFHRRID